MVSRKIYYSLSPKNRRLARRLLFSPIDIFEFLSGKREKLVPPKGKIFTGLKDFKKTGDGLLETFISLCNIQPDYHILDIGSGIGRVARPLSKFLNTEGRYVGFDVVEDGINWCKKAYSGFPNFSFIYIPLKNDLYNLTVSQEASDFKFPYSSNSFDFIFSISVFTHMQETGVENYISEVARVLKPGKKFFCSFFIITEESKSFLDNSDDPFFKFRYDNYYLHDDKVKDANIAFKFDFLQQLFSKAGLKIIDFNPGWWTGKQRKDCISFQDILILEK